MNLILRFFATSVIKHLLRFQMNQGIRTYWKLGEPSWLMNMNINSFWLLSDLLKGKGYCLQHSFGFCLVILCSWLQISVLKHNDHFSKCGGTNWGISKSVMACFVRMWWTVLVLSLTLPVDLTPFQMQKKQMIQTASRHSASSHFRPPTSSIPEEMLRTFRLQMTWEWSEQAQGVRPVHTGSGRRSILTPRIQWPARWGWWGWWRWRRARGFCSCGRCPPRSLRCSSCVCSGPRAARAGNTAAGSTDPTPGSRCSRCSAETRSRSKHSRFLMHRQNTSQ